MNCRQAEPLIFAERDGALNEAQRAALVAHVAMCPACQRMKADVASAIESWRNDTAQVRVPDADLEWQKLRREIRGDSAGAATKRSWPELSWFAVPTLAAAAVAIGLYVAPSIQNSNSSDAGSTPVAQATTPTDAPQLASTVVYVDDRSGWTFVWAPETVGKHI